MRSPWTRAAAIALTTAAVSALALINGCKTDVERADEKASADMDTATIAMDSLHPEAAREALASTTSGKGQSPDAQIESHVLAAQADEQAAGLLMSGPGSSGASAMAFRAVVEGKATPQLGSQSVSPDERANLLGIEQRQILIAELLSRMNSLTRQVAINNGNVTGYRALDPVAARQKLQQATTAAQKGDKGVWMPGTAPMASLEALKASELDLQKQIADLTAKRKDLNSKRGQALQDASKFGQQADSTTGAQSVGFFTQAANQRKDASDDETKMAQLDSQIAPLQQDLNLVQTQEKAIGDIITSYADQTQQLENGWKDLQRRIDEASALSKNLLERAESGASASTAPSADSATGASPAVVSVSQMPQSLAGLGAALDAQTKEVQALRSKVVSLLNDANKHYETASGIAATLTKSLTALATGQDAAKLPERRAWQERIALNSPAMFKLHQAGVQDRLARLYADEYAELAMRNRVLGLLAATLKQGGLTAPASLASAIPAEGGVPTDVDSKLKQYQGDLKSDQPPFEKDAAELSELSAAQTSSVAQQAVVGTQADLAYHWSANRLNDVIANAGQGDLASLLVNIGHASLMSTDYAQAQFAAMQGKDPESQADLKAALDERRALVDASAQNMLPATLPPGLAFEAKAPVAPPPPSTEPATSGAPATAPAEGAVPATQPADATAPATAPAPGTTPPPEGTMPATAPAPGTTPPATAPAPAAGTTPPVEGTPPPASAPAPGATQPGQ